MRRRSGRDCAEEKRRREWDGIRSRQHTSTGRQAAKTDSGGIRFCLVGGGANGGATSRYLDFAGCMRLNTGTVLHAGTFLVFFLPQWESQKNPPHHWKK